MTKFEIPRINLNNLIDVTKRDDELEKMRSGIFNLGFFIFHDLPFNIRLIDRAVEVAKHIFSLPEETKNSFAHPEWAYQQGYIPFNQENAKTNEVADFKEIWHHKPGRIHPTVNPEVEDFDVLHELFETLEEVAIVLLEAIGQIIGRPEGHYRKCVTKGDSLLRLLHYIRDDSSNKSPWAAAHEDIGFLTILTTVADNALHVRGKNGQEYVPQLNEGELIAQIGDTLQYESEAMGDNPQLVSTTHWVENPGNLTKRISLPFFTHPKSNTPIGNTTAGEYLLKRLAEIGLKKDNNA